VIVFTHLLAGFPGFNLSFAQHHFKLVDPLVGLLLDAVDSCSLVFRVVFQSTSGLRSGCTVMQAVIDRRKEIKGCGWTVMGW
jgi:hypothetical protein